MDVKNNLLYLSVSFLALSFLGIETLEAVKPGDTASDSVSPRHPKRKREEDTSGDRDSSKKRKGTDGSPIKEDNPKKPEKEYCAFGHAADTSEDALREPAPHFPDELIIAGFLPNLTLEDFLNFCVTNKALQQVTRDPHVIAHILHHNSEQCWWNKGSTDVDSFLSDADFCADPYKYLHLAHRAPLFEEWTWAKGVVQVLLALPLEVASAIGVHHGSYLREREFSDHDLLKIISLLASLSLEEIIEKGKALIAHKEHLCGFERRLISLSAEHIDAIGVIASRVINHTMDESWQNNIIRRLISLEIEHLAAIKRFVLRFSTARLQSGGAAANIMEILVSLNAQHIDAMGIFVEHTFTSDSFEGSLWQIVRTLSHVAPEEILFRQEAITDNTEIFFPLQSSSFEPSVERTGTLFPSFFFRPFL